MSYAIVSPANNVLVGREKRVSTRHHQDHNMSTTKLLPRKAHATKADTNSREIQEEVILFIPPSLRPHGCTFIALEVPNPWNDLHEQSPNILRYGDQVAFTSAESYARCAVLLLVVGAHLMTSTATVL